MKTENLVQIKDIPYIYLDSDTLSGEIEEVSKKVLGIRQQLADKITEHKKLNPLITPIEQYKSIKLDVSYYDGIEITLACYREKTAEEIKKAKEETKLRKAAAIKSAKTRKLAQEKREKTLYENLKKKYGN